MDVILSPIVTEKSVEDMKKGKYAFRVGMDSDKYGIKKSIEQKFSVTVTNVATINVKKKIRKTMQRRTITTPAYKKAIVKVKDGEKIDVFGTGGKK